MRRSRNKRSINKSRKSERAKKRLAERIQDQKIVKPERRGIEREREWKYRMGRKEQGKEE